MGRLDGDIIVGLLGIVIAVVLVSRSSAMHRMSSSRRWVYGALWAIIIGLVAMLAQRFEI